LCLSGLSFLPSLSKRKTVVERYTALILPSEKTKKAPGVKAQHLLRGCWEVTLGLGYACPLCNYHTGRPLTGGHTLLVPWSTVCWALPPEGGTPHRMAMLCPRENQSSHVVMNVSHWDTTGFYFHSHTPFLHFFLTKPCSWFDRVSDIFRNTDGLFASESISVQILACVNSPTPQKFLLWCNSRSCPSSLHRQSPSSVFIEMEKIRPYFNTSVCKSWLAVHSNWSQQTRFKGPQKKVSTRMEKSLCSLRMGVLSFHRENRGHPGLMHGALCACCDDLCPLLTPSLSECPGQCWWTFLVVGDTGAWWVDAREAPPRSAAHRIAWPRCHRCPPWENALGNKQWSLISENRCKKCSLTFGTCGIPKVLLEESDSQTVVALCEFCSHASCGCCKHH
jgi:hypothetical protein